MRVGTCGWGIGFYWADLVRQERGNSNLSEPERRAAFARLFAQHDRWLFAYLVSLLGNAAHAEEVFQEVCVVLWREYETFQLGTDFVKWVSVIAHHQVHRFRRQQRRVGPQLSDAAVDLLAQDAVERVDLLESRRDALRGCLEKLPDKRSATRAALLRRQPRDVQDGGPGIGPAGEHAFTKR